ncbi:hypothetical protein JYB88_14370 [Shewanella cyperi]|uniref:Uncharacterized protein n=1 Tax=Shewanella cyperi TaxID=2814292 RepID=A0A974XRX7_9GAMM|nr:hypothetical protein [Shewanella cyperi]QSX29379.1 hypothetical protein JYB88_14370 [Shewanella cyperi]
MSSLALTLLLALQTAPIAGKEALLCPLPQLQQCLASLQPGTRQQLPGEHEISRLLGGRSAMVLPLEDAKVAGLVLLAPERDASEQSAIIAGKTYVLPLARQSELTLWHELGHLEVQALRGSVLPVELTEYQQEWLADAYLLWRSVRETGELTLAWQQFHRRNLAVISDIGNISHWSSLLLIHLLKKYDLSVIAEYASFAAFCGDFYPDIPELQEAGLAEFSSLLQRTFGPGYSQPLPGYMYWRKPALAQVISPTLLRLMGKSATREWLEKDFGLAFGQ